MVVKKQKHIYRPTQAKNLFCTPIELLIVICDNVCNSFQLPRSASSSSRRFDYSINPFFSSSISIFQNSLPPYKQPPSVPTKSHRISSVHPSVCVYPAHHPPVRSANYYSPYRYNVPVANRNRIAYKRLRGALLGYNSLDPPLELWPAANWGNHPFVPLPPFYPEHINNIASPCE